MKKEYDVIVIGTGTSGYTLAYACKKEGKSVAVVDSRPYGGTCAMRGCQPKKYLVAAAEVVELASNMSDIGIENEPEIDWSSLMSSKDKFVDAVPDNTEKGFKKAGIDTHHGHACFIGSNSIFLNEKTLVGKNIVLASGSLPIPLEIPGDELVATSDEFMLLKSLPKEIIFLGGGFISFEFAHVANQAGSKVTILHRSANLLKRFDRDLVDKLVEASKAAGIRILTDIIPQKIESKNGKTFVHCGEGRDQSFSADLIVHGAGRFPDILKLELEKGNVEYSKKGIVVNEYMQSVSNPSIYAIGDASSTPYQLATTGDMEGAVAATNIIHGNSKKADYTAIPSSVFTLPPLATVGANENEAQDSGKKIKINFGDMTRWPSSRRIGQKHAIYKVIIDEDSQQILGAHLLGHNAGEAINIFAMAMNFDLTTEDLKKVLWAYPTYVSDIKYMIN